MRLILASTSPRRRELLAALRLPFSVQAGPELDERALLESGEGGLPQRLEALARAKGADVSAANPDALVLSADTAVVLPGEIDYAEAEAGDFRYTASVLGKPADVDEAAAMLASLSGRMHHVISAVALQREADGFAQSGWEVTQVYFNALSEKMIARYIGLEAPLDKAGAYAIQGLGALLVSRIEGDYTNVVGLPLGLCARLLSEAGIRVL